MGLGLSWVWPDFPASDFKFIGNWPIPFDYTQGKLNALRTGFVWI